MWFLVQKWRLCLLVTVLPQPNFCWSSFVVRHSVTDKSPGVVCCSPYMQILFESQVPLCASLWCARPGLCLCCFSMSYWVTFVSLLMVLILTWDHVNIVLTLGLIQSISGSALVLMLKQMAVEGTLGNACYWLWLQSLVRWTVSPSRRERSLSRWCQTWSVGSYDGFCRGKCCRTDLLHQHVAGRHRRASADTKLNFQKAFGSFPRQTHLHWFQKRVLLQIEIW